MASGGRTPRTPPPQPPPSSPSSQDPIYSYTSRKCIVLVDWWLERKDGKICISGRTETPQIRDGSLSSKRKIGTVTRLYTGVIKLRYDAFSVETVSGGSVLINGPLNESKMRENGFSDQVYRDFRYGIPREWNKLDDPVMEHTDERPDSPLEPVDPAVVEWYLDMLVKRNRRRYCSGQNYSGSHVSSNLVQPAISNVYKTSVKTEDVSEQNEGRSLGEPHSAPSTGANKRKRTQRKASNNKGLANEVLSSTANLTSNENSSSVAGSDVKDKLPLHASHGKGRKKAGRKRSMSKRGTHLLGRKKGGRKGSVSKRGTDLLRKHAMGYSPEDSKADVQGECRKQKRAKQYL